MNGCTVNIADFRCRAIKVRPASFSTRMASGSYSISSDLGETGSKEIGSEAVRFAIVQEDPTVYDIGVAREQQRLRHRAVFRPISIQRRAKVLRFRDELPIQMVARKEERRSLETWSGSDLPPAA